jgi:5-methyltetrahydropteroyltriglutamate--homocysteine methyltransferase
VNRSGAKILTTHVGSLPGLASFDPAAPDYSGKLKAGVADVVRRQLETGLDIINEGEYTKAGDWLSYVDGRFGGFKPGPPPSGVPVILQGKDREEFSAFYQYATEKGTLFYAASNDIKQKRQHWVCTGPITYRGQAAVWREIDLLLQAKPAANEAFLTATAPASLEPYWRNEFYKTDDEFVFALAEALRIEYELIAGAGLILQVDDAWLPALWGRIGIQMGLDAFLKRCTVWVDALNHALRNVPEDKIRYHLSHPEFHQACRQGECHRRCRLRLRRPFASADRLGEAEISRRRRCAGEPRFVLRQRASKRRRTRALQETGARRNTNSVSS